MIRLLEAITLTDFRNERETGNVSLEGLFNLLDFYFTNGDQMVNWVEAATKSEVFKWAKLLGVENKDLYNFYNDRIKHEQV